MLLGLKLLKAPKSEILTRHDLPDANNILAIKKPVLQTPSMNPFRRLKNLCKPSCLKTNSASPHPAKYLWTAQWQFPPLPMCWRCIPSPSIFSELALFFPPKWQRLSHSYMELPWPLQEKENSQQSKQVSVTNLSLPLKHPPSGIVGNSGTL